MTISHQTSTLGTEPPGHRTTRASFRNRLGLWTASIAAAVGLTAALVACGGGSDFGSVAPPTTVAAPNVSVPSYTVGGTVLNLNVTGLSVGLTAAGATGTFAVPPNVGTFTFTTTLPTSTTYSAVITQQPLGFTQICALTNGAGTIASANINNVSISCHTATAVVTTVAGTTTSGALDGPGNVATFYRPHGVTVDSSGNLWVGEAQNDLVREITPAGVVSTVVAPITCSGNVVWCQPNQLAIDSKNNVYVADPDNNAIRVLSPAGVITTIGGGGGSTSGNNAGTVTVANALFSYPLGVAVDANDNIYVSDGGNNSVRMISTSGVVSTLAVVSGNSNLYGLAVDKSGNVFVANRQYNNILKITSGGTVSVFAGSSSGTSGYLDGAGTAALLNYPSSVAVDGAGYIYVADSNNNLLRKIDSAGNVTTLAGGGSVGGTLSGATNGVGTSATFNYLWGVTADKAGNLYIGDNYNNMIRKVTPQ